mmetsp:Transcript_17838/g.53472  ORF Transcript_17838/g.53472 Transcript_17838/m.53472 type:complete len:209 (-) Transcript_17838:518-1144(-)
MELHFPAWDASINRHMIVHVAESIARVGPCHVTSVLSYERLWKTLADALTQKTNAEAVMIRSFRAHQILSRLTGTSAEDVGVALLDRVHDGNARARGLECVVHDGKDIYLDVSKSAGLAAVVEMHKLFLRDLTCRTTEYAALWATFVAERGIILTTRSTNLTWGKALKDWYAWGQVRTASDAGSEETLQRVRRLCNGPSKFVQRAHVL